MPKLYQGFLNRPIAHRGFHDASSGILENSRAAIVGAIERGFAIELDLQLSHDGEAMVFHDYDMTRLTGIRGPIQMCQSDDLRKIHLTIGGETIPDLAEILELVSGKTPLLIELKDQDGALGPNVGRLEKRVAELLSNYDGPAAVMSFNPNSMMEMKKLAPHIIRGLTTDNFGSGHWAFLPRKRASELFDIPDYDPVGASFISHYWRSLESEQVKTLKDRGETIICFTIKNELEEVQARAIADNITFEGYTPIARKSAA